jgi:hypothetical protein
LKDELGILRKMKKLVGLALISLCLVSTLFVFFPKAQGQSESRLLNLRVSNYTWYIGSFSGYFIVVGEVQNNMSEIISNAIPTGTAYSVDGAVLATPDYGVIYATQLLPNETAGFYLAFPATQSASGDLSWSNNVSRVDFSFYGTIKNTDDSIGLTVSDSASVDSSGNYIVSGLVLNNGNTYPQNVMVVGTFYDINGEVVGIGYTSTYIAQYLQPYASATFQYTVFDPATGVMSNIASHKTRALFFGSASTTPPSSSPSESISPSASPSSSASPSQEPTSSEDNKSNVPSMTSIYVIVAAVVIAAVIIALALVLRRGKKAKAN